MITQYPVYVTPTDERIVAYMLQPSYNDVTINAPSSCYHAQLHQHQLSEYFLIMNEVFLHFLQLLDHCFLNTCFIKLPITAKTR